MEPILADIEWVAAYTLEVTWKDNLEWPMDLTCMFLDCRRKPQYPDGTHAHSAQNGPAPAGFPA